jgi:homoaconitase/3-isopropylmalate dehydratase large subunit
VIFFHDAERKKGKFIDRVGILSRRPRGGAGDGRRADLHQNAKGHGVRLTGRLPDWVSAKDVTLEMLRRYGVSAGYGKIVEYYGPGLDRLSAMDRHVIANMGTELGATTTVFPSDANVQKFLAAQGRGDAWREILPYRSNIPEISKYAFTRNEVYRVAHNLSGRQLEMVLAGSLINVVRDRQ